MFQVGDTVIYGTNGACRITGVTQKEFGQQKSEYYVLNPVYDPRSTIFVPKDNAILLAKMRRVLSAEEIYRLIRTLPQEESGWIDQEEERKKKYAAVIAGGDRRELLKVIRALYLHRQRQKAAGRRMHIADERFFHEAEKILYDEFALVLHIRPDQVQPFILQQVELAKRGMAEAQPEKAAAFGAGWGGTAAG